MRVALISLTTLAAARARGASEDQKKLDTMRRNANNLARAETILTQLIDKQWAERIETAARDRDRQKRALENFVAVAFARLDAVPGATSSVDPPDASTTRPNPGGPDDRTPTAVPTTYPTPSRRCYRYAAGAATYYAACGDDEPFFVLGAVAEYRGACAGLDAVGACLVAARCSIIDVEAVGPPEACGDAITGRVHRV